MADIKFIKDRSPSSDRRNPKNSRLTQFIIDKSFGLISTSTQAAVAKLIFASILFVIAGYIFSKSGDSAIPTKTPQNLIDAPQPTRPLN
jgi:hypothetical protein